MQQNHFKNKIMIHQDMMFRFALRMLQNEEDAKDIVQDSLLKLWNKRKGLKNIKSYKSFAMTIVRNASIDLIRKRKNDSVEPDLLIEKENLNPENQLEVADQLRKVREIINKLNDQQKELIQMRDIEGLDYTEIQEITGLSINTIRVNISRARKEIRSQMLAKMNFQPQIMHAI